MVAIRGITLGCIQDFLVNRTKQVVINQHSITDAVNSIIRSSPRTHLAIGNVESFFVCYINDLAIDKLYAYDVLICRVINFVANHKMPQKSIDISLMGG